MCGLGCGMGRGRVSRKIRWESLKFTRIFLFDRSSRGRLQGGRISWGDRGSEAAFGSWCLDREIGALSPVFLCFCVSPCFPPLFFLGRSGVIFLICCFYPFRAIGLTYTKVTHDASKPLPKPRTTVMNSMLLWKASYWMGGLGALVYNSCTFKEKERVKEEEAAKAREFTFCGCICSGCADVCWVLLWNASNLCWAVRFVYKCLQHNNLFILGKMSWVAPQWPSR